MGIRKVRNLTTVEPVRYCTFWNSGSLIHLASLQKICECGSYLFEVVSGVLVENTKTQLWVEYLVSIIYNGKN